MQAFFSAMRGTLTAASAEQRKASKRKGKEDNATEPKRRCLHESVTSSASAGGNGTPRTFDVLESPANGLHVERFAIGEWHPRRHVLAAGPPGSCWLLLFETLPLDLRVNDALFQELWALRPANLGMVRIFGKQVTTPRWTQAYGESYTFSGTRHVALPLATHPFLQHVQSRLSELSGCPYTQMLVNWYADGHHRIGWHSDDEGALARPEWDPAAAIGVWSFSYGATRHFDLRPKPEGKHGMPVQKTELRWPAANNTCIGMFGETQRYYKHQVPTQSTIREPRINITLRVFGAPFLSYLRELRVAVSAGLKTSLLQAAGEEHCLIPIIMSYVSSAPGQ